MSARTSFRAAYWATLRQLRRVRHPHIGDGSRVAWGARLLGGARTVVIGRDCWIEEHCVIDARGGGRIEIGDQSELHRYACLMSYGGELRLGRNCSVNPFTILYGHGGLQIGDGVRIAAHVTVIPAQHEFKRSDMAIREQGLSARGIVIEDDVWVGTGARILDGCRIGRGSVIGAGAVVTADIEPFSVAVGVPARRVGARGVQAR